MPLKFVKSRDVIIEKIDDYTYDKSIEDDKVNEMIIDFTSEDAIDKEGNKCIVNAISSGNIIIKRMENHLQKFQDAIKNLSSEELQKLKKELPKVIEKYTTTEKLDKNLIHNINNIENYLGKVEVLTVVRRRIFDVYTE